MPGGWVTQARVPKGVDDTGGEWTDGLLGWARTLPPNQRDALLVYGSTDYRGINQQLRSGLPPPDTNNVGERIDGIDQALTTAPPLVEEATVFRGMDLRGFTPEVGATFTDQAFISTSMDLSVAEKFSERAIGDGASAGDVAITEIRVPPGTRGVPMFKVWEARMGKDGPVGKQMAREREIILNRGSRFRVTKVGRDSKGVVRLALELLPKAA